MKEVMKEEEFSEHLRIIHLFSVQKGPVIPQFYNIIIFKSFACVGTQDISFSNSG